MLKYQLNSGKILELNLAPTETALALFRAVTIECRKCELKLNITPETNMYELLTNNSEAILKLLGSEAVMEAVKDCCGKVLYNKQRFTMDLFEDEQARADFFGVMIIVALENLLPFFPSLRTYSEIILSLFLK